MKLFKKNGVLFAVLLIIIYVVGMSVMQDLSGSVGVSYLAEALFSGAMSVFLMIFIIRGKMAGYLGLRAPEVTAGKMLFYIPLLITGAVTAFFGMGSEYGALSSVLAGVSMVFVGFIEEVIFRGFLFRGIAKESVKRAAIISAVTFGIGHFVNLLNGKDLLENSIQVVFAVAAGFMLVFIFLRTGSIIPCVVFHSLNNCIAAFSTGKLLTDSLGETGGSLIAAGAKILIAVGYTIYVMRLPERELPE